MSTGLPVLEIAVEAGSWPPEAALHARFEEALGAALHVLGEAGANLSLDQGEISVLLCDDGAMRAINLAHRGQDKATNVLSFPALEAEALLKLAGALPSAPFLLGDLVFAQETLAREAVEAGLSLDHHLAHLIVHGFLHLLGYDHLNDEEAEIMEALETRALARLGIGDPYQHDITGHAMKSAFK